MTPRKMFQDVGDFCRSIRHDFFLTIIASKIEGKKNRRLVVSDVRFENEAQLIRDNGGIIIKIIRPEIDTLDLHASETGSTKIKSDFIIMNNANVQVLYSDVDEILTFLLINSVDL